MEKLKSHGNASQDLNSLNFSKTEDELKEEAIEKGTEMTEMKPIEDSPFTAVRMEDKWFLTMGKYRLTEPLASEEACRIQATDASWMRLMQIINIMIKESDEINDLKRQLEQTINKGI